jgi:cholesterol transport system auxiliary component
VLDVSHPGTTVPSADGAVLTIRKLRVSPRYEGKELVYRTGNLSYESDFYNEFFITPSALFTEEVRQWLAAAGLFQHVVDSASSVEATYILEGNVLTLYGDYRDNNAPHAVLEMQFFLLENISARSEIVFQKTYRQEISLSARSTTALIQGWNEALRAILTMLETDLRATALTGRS